MKSQKRVLPKVAIVIPHRGEDAGLERCLDALAVQSYPASLLETIVVVNERQERSLSFSPNSDVTVLQQTEFFSYAARNRGVRKATADVIAFTDSDTVPAHDWITEGVSALSDGFDIVAGHINLSFTKIPLSPAACYEKLYAFDQQKNAAAGYAATANLFVIRQSFHRLGMFKETSYSGEDFEWTRRATQAGAKLGYSPTAKVTHPARETMSELLAKARRKTHGFSGSSEKPYRSVGSLLKRGVHLLLRPPSPDKSASVEPYERVKAHLVKSLILMYQFNQLVKSWGRA